MLNLNFVVTVLLLVVSSLFAEFSPGWISLCTPTETRKIYSGGCPRGVSFHKPINVNSACVNGLWILSNGHCDKNPVVLVGRGNADCFTLGIQVTSAMFVGKPGDPFSSGDFVSTEYLNVFWRLDLDQRSSDNVLFSGGHALVSINSQNAIEAVRNDGSADCCRADYYDTAPVRICIRENTAHHFRVKAACTESADAVPAETTISLNYGEGMRLEQGKFSKFLKIYADSGSGSCGTSPIDLETDCCSALDLDEHDAATGGGQKRIDEQTVRIAKKYLHWTLGKRKEPKVEHSEYVYVQIARRIVSHVCPADFPSHLSLAVLHIFRLLLSDTIAHSPLVKNFEAKSHEKIMEALKGCLNLAKANPPIKINWTPKNVCPSEVISVTAGSKSYPIGTSLNDTLLYKSLDFPLESIWKMMTFTHYFCANQFRAHPVDHSALMVSFESFFNMDLLRRWANPGKSFDVLKLLFPVVDLLRAAAALDACVEFAQTASDYKKWIERPKLVPLGQNANFQPLNSIWNNSATCLNSYWDVAGEDIDSSCFPPYANFYQTKQ